MAEQLTPVRDTVSQLMLTGLQLTDNERVRVLAEALETIGRGHHMFRGKRFETDSETMRGAALDALEEAFK